MTESRINRRDFFKETFGLGLALTGCETENGHEKSPTSFVAVEAFRSQRKKIDYTGDKKEITPEIKELLFKLQDFRQLVRQQYKTYSGSEADLNTVRSKQVEKTDNDHSQQIELLSAKNTMAKYLGKFFPKLNGSYSEESFYHCLLHEVPELLSHYGIFVKPIPAYAFRDDNRAFALADAFLTVFPVRKVTRQDNVKQWGRSFQRDILEVGSDLVLDGKSLNSSKDAYSEGQTFYQNIVIYDDGNDSKKLEKIQFAPEMMKLIAELGNLDREQLLELASKTNAVQQDQLAYILLFAKIGHKVLDDNTTNEEGVDVTIAHESRHVIDQKEQVFADKFTPPLSSDASVVLGQIGNGGAHDEINGLLGQLRYSRKPFYAFFGMTQWLGGEMKTDFQHDRAIQWTFDKIVEKILSKPADFDAVIDDSSGVSPKNQVILQLDKVVSDTKVFGRMVEEIMAYHESHYDEDFSEEYLKSFNLPKNQLQDNRNYWPVAAGGALGVLAVLEILRRRKQEIALQDSLSKKSATVTHMGERQGKEKKKKRKREKKIK